MWLGETIRLRLQMAKRHLMRSQEAWSLCYRKIACLCACACAHHNDSLQEHFNNMMSNESDSFTRDTDDDDQL